MGGAQLSSYTENLLDPATVMIRRSERGSLILCLCGVTYQELNIRRAFPLEDEEKHIGFFLSDGTELGMIADLANLDEDSRGVLTEEMAKMYFRPRILHINSLAEEHGVLRGEADTTSGPRKLEIRNYRKKIRLLSQYRALIEDVDGNRYQIDDWRRLPKSIREILGL